VRVWAARRLAPTLRCKGACGEHAARTPCQHRPCATHVKARPGRGALKPGGAKHAGPAPRAAAPTRRLQRPSSAGLQRFTPSSSARQVTRLDFLPEHAASYNELVEVVERNLLLADWRDENHEESMLHVRNAVWGAQMLQNLRRAAAGARPCSLLLRLGREVPGSAMGVCAPSAADPGRAAPAPACPSSVAGAGAPMHVHGARRQRAPGRQSVNLGPTAASCGST